MALTAAGGLALGGCAASQDDDVSQPSLDQERDSDVDREDNEVPARPDGDTTLEHTLVFEHLGMIGYQRAEIEPDGAITVTYNLGDPATTMLDDDDLAQVLDAVEAAQLAEQPSEIKADEVVIDDETVYRFEYGDAHIEAEWTLAPAELRDLGSLLAELTAELVQEQRSDG